MKTFLEYIAANDNKPPTVIDKIANDNKKPKKKIEEISPPGWKGTTEAMKKHKDITNPWALAYWMQNKGYKSHKNPDSTDK